ncbi:MAG TPA: group II intron reverse transcriptase/maturase [Thermoanaerobaculia bacterium]|nr:group II intron reverse transcriptase/maturase [Thermoanaerobaculia bacterium]
MPQSAETSSEESDEGVVPKKSAKTWVTPVESMEGRPEAKGKPAARNTSSTQSENDVATALQRVGQRAKERPKERFTNLLTHLQPPLLERAYQSLKKDAAAGVDDVTWDEYGTRLDEHLLDLTGRIHRGSYHPQPVRRVHIPKGDGRTRPLGIPALEDKIVQQAARWVLEPIYEAMFVGMSYGFRPRRSQHDALDALAVAIGKKVSWVLDADIRSFFDAIDHGWMQKFLEHRIGDKRMVRLVMKWMRAGVMEDGKLREVGEGTPQGGNISPLLANIFLHYALDLWALDWRKKRASGEVYFVRYADDFVMGFQREQDAFAMHSDLSERLAKFGLELHSDKTRVIQFGRFACEQRERQGLSKPETFDFLGFTHIASTDRAGRFQLKRRTSRKKRRAKLARLRDDVRRRRHDPVPEQHEWLSSVLRGHYRYYAVPTNYRALAQFKDAVQRLWYEWLQRRSQRARWSQNVYRAFQDRFPLPDPRILHPWPERRFAAR